MCGMFPLYTAQPLLTASVQILNPSEEQEPGAWRLFGEGAYWIEGVQKAGCLGSLAFSLIQREESPRCGTQWSSNLAII